MSDDIEKNDYVQYKTAAKEVGKLSENIRKVLSRRESRASPGSHLENSKLSEMKEHFVQIEESQTLRAASVIQPTGMQSPIESKRLPKTTQKRVSYK